jgi:hypothetical protein
MYHLQIISQISPVLFEKGTKKRVPITGKNITTLANDISNLVADKKTSTISSHVVSSQKPVGAKSRKK